MYFLAGYLPAHNFAPLMVVSITCGESGLVYEGSIHTVEEYGDRYFYQHE
jgi:hypothetical protein